METRKVQGKTLFRAAEFRLDSLNEESRTIDVIWTTGFKGKRRSWWSGEEWFEELEVSDKAVRLERLNSGTAPFLRNHNAYSLDGVIGVVERAWIQNGVGYATVRFSDREDAEKIFRDVSNKILRNISVGYNVHRYIEEIQDGDQIKTLRATDWEPLEISLVPIGFDPEAQTRANAAPVKDIEILSNIHDRSPGMGMNANPSTEPTQRQEAAPVGEPAKTPNVDVEAEKRAAAKQAAEDERKRVLEIRKAVTQAKLGEQFADELIRDGVSLDEARAMIIDKWAENDQKEPVRSQCRIEVGDHNEVQTRRDAVTGALMYRFNPDGKQELNDASRQFRGMSLLEIGRHLLEARGINTRGMGRTELATRALHSGSDFAHIVANVANNSMRLGYEAAPQTFQPIVRITQAPDFKQIQRSQLGDGSALDLVPENGEYKRGTMTDGKETYRILKYGKIFGISREAIINDSMEAFTAVPMKFGRRAGDKESDLVWGVFTGNPAMGDGKELFHTDHGNLAGSGAAISETTLNAARKAMRTQTGLDNEKINIFPRFLIGPASIESTVRKFLSTDLLATKASDVNTHRGTMDPIIEPRLDDASTTAWYVAADPSQVDIIEMAYLEGQRGVYLESRDGFDTDGVEFKVRLEVGVKAMDWRGLYKNPGA